MPLIPKMLSSMIPGAIKEMTPSPTTLLVIFITIFGIISLSLTTDSTNPEEIRRKKGDAVRSLNVLLMFTVLLVAYFWKEGKIPKSVFPKDVGLSFYDAVAA